MRRTSVSRPLLLPLRRLTRTLQELLPATALFSVALAALYAGFRLAHRPHHILLLPSHRLEVTVLNVGQGEASFVKTPDERFAVIGTGPPGHGAHLVAALKEAGAKKIDLLILPYAYSEAIGGTAELVAAFPIDAVIASSVSGAPLNQWDAQSRALCTARSIPLRAGIAGETLKLGRAKLTILAPGPVHVAASPAGPNNSVVVRLDYGKTAFLWAGGLDRAGEQTLLSRTPDLSADWLRVARFGTANACSPEFLRLVSPTDAIISVGGNPSGYPSQDTLTRLQAIGATIYRTDAAPKSLVFSSDGVQLYSPPAP